MELRQDESRQPMHPNAAQQRWRPLDLLPHARFASSFRREAQLRSWRQAAVALGLIADAQTLALVGVGVEIVKVLRLPR